MNADRKLTALEQALQNAAADTSMVDAFYDTLLDTDLVVGTLDVSGRAENGAADGDGSASLAVVTDKDGFQHLAVFASDAAMDAWSEADKVGRLVVPAADLIAGIGPKMRIALNPGLDIGKAFDTKELSLLRQMIKRRTRAGRKSAAKSTKVAFSAITQIGGETYDKLAAAVAARRTLKAIYLLDVEDEQLPAGHYMLVLIDVRPSDFEAVSDRIIDLFTNLFEEGTPVEIGCLQDERMWADIVDDHAVQPIYPKAH